MTRVGDLDNSQGDTDEKKLWLDYLSRLRDREDRSNQITGITNWVLYGLMGTLFYKAFGFFSTAFSDGAYRYNTYLFVVLGFNLVVFGQLAIDDLLPRIRDRKTDIRALPERVQVLLTSYAGLFGIAAAILGLVEFWLGYQDSHLARTVRYSLFVFGSIHIIIGLAFGIFFYIKNKLDHLQQGLFPQFRGAALKGGRTADVFMFLAAIASLGSIIMHARDSMQTASTWLLSMQSAFGILMFLWAAYRLIVLRPSRTHFIAAIAELEQQALVENLSATVIRQRFVELTSGIRLSEWLQRSSESITKVWEDIGKFVEATAIEADRLCSLPPSNDKVEKLQEMKQKIAKDTTGYDKPFTVSSLQIGATVAINWAIGGVSSKETINRFKEFKKEADGFSLRLRAVFERLDTELVRTKDELKDQATRKAFSATDQA